MNLEGQKALLGQWRDFLKGRRPSAVLMREFYFDVVTCTPHYYYGMAPELFDLLINGTFELDDSRLWSSAFRTGGHRAA